MFDCKMFDVANWVAGHNGENGPGGMPSHEALSVSPQRALENSSVVRLPPSLDRNHFSTPRMVAESHKRDERCRPSSQRPQYPTLYRRLKRRLGRPLRANLYKGSVVRQGKSLHINVLELKVVSLALQRFKDQCQNQTVLVSTDNSTVVLRVRFSELGLCKRGFQIFILFIKSNPRKIQYYSSLSCNPSTGWLDSVFSSTW